MKKKRGPPWCVRAAEHTKPAWPLPPAAITNIVTNGVSQATLPACDVQPGPLQRQAPPTAGEPCARVHGAQRERAHRSVGRHPTPARDPAARTIVDPPPLPPDTHTHTRARARKPPTQPRVCCVRQILAPLCCGQPHPCRASAGWQLHACAAPAFQASATGTIACAPHTTTAQLGGHLA